MNRIYGQSTRRLWPHAGGNGRLRAYHSPRGLLCAPVTSQDGAAYARGGKGKMVPSQAAGLAKGGIARPAAGQRRCQRHHNRRHHRHRSGRSRGPAGGTSDHNHPPNPRRNNRFHNRHCHNRRRRHRRCPNRRHNGGASASVSAGFRAVSPSIAAASRHTIHPAAHSLRLCRDQASATFLRGVFRGAEPGTRDFGPGPPARRSATRTSGRPAHDPCIRRDAGLSG